MTMDVLGGYTEEVELTTQELQTISELDRYVKNLANYQQT